MITIIGAGMGGLTFGSILHRGGVECEIYDADVSVDSRHQGGMLDIHEDTGQAALKAAGLLESFHRITLDEGDAMCVRDSGANLLLSDPGNGSRPEVDRGTLRNLLFSSLPEGIVHWNSKVVEVHRCKSGFDIVFAGGKVHSAGLLVGADGAWSKVRPLLTSVVPIYSGFCFVELRLFNATRAYPQIADLVGKGLMFALSPGKALIAHREPNDEICVYAAIQAFESELNMPISVNQLRDRFADWHPDFLKIFAPT